AVFTPGRASTLLGGWATGTGSASPPGSARRAASRSPPSSPASGSAGWPRRSPAPAPASRSASGSSNGTRRSAGRSAGPPAGSGSSRSSAARSHAAAREERRRSSSSAGRSPSRRSRSSRCSATSRRWSCRPSGSGSAAARASGTPGCGSLRATSQRGGNRRFPHGSPSLRADGDPHAASRVPGAQVASAARKLVAIVIDGLTPAALERAVERRTAPALKHLVEHGDYGYATSVFPSLTPVCMSSIATGAYPDVHRIPHLVWYHRAEQRLVEYGSSFGAIMAAGTRRSILDTILYMNERHLSPAAVTVYEALDDAGLTTAAVTVTCYRGRTPPLATIPIPRSALGPRRFFYYNLFESDVTGAPLSVRRRPAGTVDGYAAAVGRWLVTRDGFDFLFYYLSDYDYFSHVTGPEAADDALARADEAVGALLDAAGGPDEFLQRYAVVLFADHGQTPVTTPIRLEDAFA